MTGLHVVSMQHTHPPPKSRNEGLAGWVIRHCHELWTNLGQHREKTRHMRLVETISLGGRKQLMLVSCGGERFLVGTGAENVQTITRVRPEVPGPVLRPGTGILERY